MMSLNDALRNNNGPFTWFAGHDMRSTAFIPRIAPDAVTTAQIPVQRDELRDTKFDNTLSTIDLLQFFANTLAIISAVGMVLNVVYTGQMLSHANIWLLATALISAATGYNGRREAGDHPLALRIRNTMVLGLSLGMMAFAGAACLVALELIHWFFSL